MSYDTWKTTDPDPHPEGRSEPSEPLHRCRDCALEVYAGGHGAPLVQAVYCDDCYRWRTEHGVEFDTRVKSQILATLRQGAA